MAFHVDAAWVCMIHTVQVSGGSLSGAVERESKRYIVYHVDNSKLLVCLLPSFMY